MRAYEIGPDGSVGPYRVLHDFGDHRPIDGRCLDGEGCIVATAGYDLGVPGRLIWVFSPDGDVLGQHPLPPEVGRPTNCAFGGPDLGDLYVTGSNGCLHRARTDRHGLPLRR